MSLAIPRTHVLRLVMEKLGYCSVDTREVCAEEARIMAERLELHLDTRDGRHHFTNVVSTEL